MSSFRQRLSEVIAWYSSKTVMADLRTVTLFQSDREAETDFLRLTISERKIIVEDVASRRANLLKSEGRYPTTQVSTLASGRLLAFNPDHSLFDGAAEAESEGFFDWDNVPAWDTWICYIEETAQITNSNEEWNSFLLAWVPSELVELVNNGIEVNPEQSIIWAKDLSSPTIHQLGQNNLLE